MIAGAVCFARERERATLLRLRHRANNSVFMALHAKSALYLFIATLLMSGIFFVLFPLYGAISIQDSYAALPSIALYLLACWWMGAFTGILTGKVMLSAEICIFIGMPAFIFSGWTFPLSAVPKVMVYGAHILPFTHFMPAWFKTARMGLSALSPIRELAVLLGSAIFYQAAAYALLAYKWNKPHKRRISDREAHHA
jgi:ABC-2 type transport system permease protein